MSRSLLVRLSLVLLVLGQAGVVLAQSAGSLRGTVADKTGAVLPGATVTLTNEATKFARTAVTDAKGQFFFAAVDVGNYTLKAELQGFKTYEAKGVRINANSTANADVGLEVGTQSETVDVTATRDIIRTDSGAREGVITPGQIESLSVIGRNPTELLRTLPGVHVSQRMAGEPQPVDMQRSRSSSMQSTCVVQLYVDGQPYPNGNLDDFAPLSLEGVEVYRSASEIPADFRTRNATCGLISLWTRDPEAARRKP